MTTRYHPRTDVERWQLQDRLVMRLRALGWDARPRFFEAPGGHLAFRIWLGWRPPADAATRLAAIDERDAESGAATAPDAQDAT